MTDLLQEFSNVKGEFTQENIDKMLELLEKAKGDRYEKNAEEIREKIARIEDEASWVTFQKEGKTGKIKICGACLPPRSCLKNIPEQSCTYVAENGYWSFCLVQPRKKPLIESTYLFATIQFVNKSPLPFHNGDLFTIADEEFIVVGEGVAFKKKSIQKFRDQDLGVCMLPWGRMMAALDRWLDDLREKARREQNQKGE